MRRRTFLAAALLGMGGAGAAEPPWDALAEGGAILLLRHAQTVAGLGDPPGFRVDDCRTQRNLSDEGRRQSERIGRALASRGVRIDHVLSSRWCRCLDTARLAFPAHTVEPFQPLDSFFADRGGERVQTRAALERALRARPPGNLVFVTHQVNVMALTGESVGSGVAVVARPADGALRVVGRLVL